MKRRIQNMVISMVLVAGISIFLFAGIAVAQNFSAELLGTPFTFTVFK